MILRFPHFNFRSVLIGLFSSVVVSFPSQAAEKIYFIFDSLSFSLPVSSIERYAREGVVDQNMAFYLRLVNMTGIDKQQNDLFRQALTTRLDIDPVLLSRILNSDEGERLLTHFGRIINVQGGRNGKYVLRGAMVKAAFDEEGLTVTNFLNHLSTNIQINLRQSLRMARNIEKLIYASNILVDEVIRLANLEIKNDKKVDFDQLPDLRQQGPFAVDSTAKRWQLHDKSRNRRFYVDIYEPKQWKSGKTSVIVISHGLNSRPEDFSRMAIHLASYGYFVVLPQHPGSDTQQTQRFLNGLSRQISRTNEFIDRPLDVTYLLDELEKRNIREFNNQLDLENVGAIGHSFGGYTVMALAGATLDFERLEFVCNLEFAELNIALLLQCRALQLDQKNYNFKDPRITSIFTVNPVNAGILGNRGLRNIDVPVFIAAGSYDPATPFAFEQGVSFPWLNTKDKYLQLQEGQAHVDFSQLDAGITDMLYNVKQVTLPSPEVLDSYTHSMSVAFFQVYLSKSSDYRPYLQSSYAQYLSQDQDFKTHLITEKSSAQLEKFIEQFRANNNLQVPSHLR